MRESRIKPSEAKFAGLYLQARGSGGKVPQILVSWKQSQGSVIFISMVKFQSKWACMNVKNSQFICRICFLVRLTWRPRILYAVRVPAQLLRQGGNFLISIVAHLNVCPFYASLSVFVYCKIIDFKEWNNDNALNFTYQGQGLMVATPMVLRKIFYASNMLL